jgi:hypothetical protein
MNRTFLPLLASLAAAGSLAAQWTQITPATSPAARAGHAMATNPITDTILLFGGAGTFVTYNDTWTYDGSNWTQLSPVNSPTAKFYTGLVYDTSRAVYVMYGGNATYTSPGVNQTWEFDGVTWTQRFPAANPGNLGGHAMAFDWWRNRVVLYGGIKTVGPIVDSNETWEYTGTNWVNRNPATRPGRLEHHSMCFHGGVGKTILFGGVNADPSTPPGDVANDKTWAYDGNTNTWTELAIVGPRPNKRERATLAYDPVREVCVLTGGLRAQSSQAEHGTWELRFDGTNWTWTLLDNPTSGGRVNSAMAFLPGDRHMVKFGGMNVAGSTNYQETKEWGPQTATFGFGCLGTNGVPTLSAATAPHLGETYTLDITNLNPAFNLAILVFGFTQLPGVDLGPLLGMTACAGYQTADILITAPAGAGGVTSWSWTPVTGLLGDTFYCQALCLDPAVNAFGWTISNAVSATIGY